MAKRYIALLNCCVTVNDMPYYYREGDIATFPDDFKPPEGKHKDPYFQFIGQSKPAEQQKSEVEKQIESVMKENRISKRVAESLFEDKGAGTDEQKLNVLLEFVTERDAARAATKAAK